MLPNFVLIGFMGCGKSSVGRRMAAITGHRFIDTDELVAQSADRSISEIFAKEGEDGFRALEQDVLAGLVGVVGVVLATGGGAILREANRAALRQIGPVIWLDADPGTLFERATRSNRRPLLQTDDPRQTFDDLLASRRPIYEEASDFRFDSTGLGHEEVAQNILQKAMSLRTRAD